jgi:hypothetical protein
MILDNFKQQIIDVINQSGLEIDMVYYVLKDVMSDVVGIYNQQLEQEHAAAAETSVTPDSESDKAAAANIDKEEK